MTIRVRSPKPRLRGLGLLAAAAGLVALAGVGLALGPVGMPATLGEITVMNSTDYTVQVLVSGEGDAWLPLGTVEAGEVSVFHEVLDQGELWEFRFDHTR